MSKTYRRLIGLCLTNKLNDKKPNKENLIEYEKEYSIKFKSKNFYNQSKLNIFNNRSEGRPVLYDETIFDADCLVWYNERQDFYYMKSDRIPRLKRHGTKEELLFEEIEWLGWDIRIKRKNDPYVDYYYQTSSEKSKSKYELYKDLEKLVFMKLDQMYSYGSSNYRLSSESFGYFWDSEYSEWETRNKLFLGNDRRGIEILIDVKKFNTVQKVINYLLSRGYGILSPSLVPKDYDCYYYWTKQFLKDGTFINHHNKLHKKR